MTESMDALNYFFPPSFVDSMPEDHFLHGVLCNQDASAECWRQDINDCLELASKYELVDTNFIARISKGDSESFTATINELRCAKYLEEHFGAGSLRWHPEGREGKIGEFEILVSESDNSIFTEVKTIFPKGRDDLEHRIKIKLYSLVEQIALPFRLIIVIKDVGRVENFKEREFKRILQDELLKIDRSIAKDDEMIAIELPNYVDSVTGLHLEITAYPRSDKELQSCRILMIMGEVGPMGREYRIRNTLDKAYEQRSEGKQPFLVILCTGNLFHIDQDDMISALLSNLCVQIPVCDNGSIGEPEPYYKLDGVLRPEHRRQLSAIGHYASKYRDERVEHTLVIYHNPFALNPIDQNVFKGKVARQWIRTGKTQMGWKE